MMSHAGIFLSFSFWSPSFVQGHSYTVRSADIAAPANSTCRSVEGTAGCRRSCSECSRVRLLQIRACICTLYPILYRLHKTIYTILYSD